MLFTSHRVYTPTLSYAEPEALPTCITPASLLPASRRDDLKDDRSRGWRWRGALLEMTATSERCFCLFYFILFANLLVCMLDSATDM